MKLRVIQTLVIEFVRHLPGAVIDVKDEALAGRLVAAGLASPAVTLVDTATNEVKYTKIETATAEPKFETATAPASKGRGRRK
jgi:hypothetical protein